MGEWIDIEHYITNGNIINNLHYLVAIFYRKVIKEGDEYFDYEIESYNDIKLEGRAKLFQHNAYIMDVYGIAVFFLSHRKRINEQYRLLFNGDDDGGEDNENDEQNKRYRSKEEADAIAREKSIRKWNWELLLYRLSNGDITKYDRILNTNYLLILNHLSMEMELKLNK